MIGLEDFDFYGFDDDESFESIRGRQNAFAFVEKAMLCWYLNDALLTPTLRSPHYDTMPFFSLNFSISSEQSYNPRHVATKEHLFYPALSPTPPSSTSSLRSIPLTLQEESQCQLALDAGYGVDGEYDDYLIYLTAPILKVQKSKRESREKERYS